MNRDVRLVPGDRNVIQRGHRTETRQGHRTLNRDRKTGQRNG